jgi:hypothetical protein
MRHHRRDWRPESQPMNAMLLRNAITASPLLLFVFWVFYSRPLSEAAEWAGFVIAAGATLTLACFLNRPKDKR